MLKHHLGLLRMKCLTPAANLSWTSEKEGSTSASVGDEQPSDNAGCCVIPAYATGGAEAIRLVLLHFIALNLRCSPPASAEKLELEMITQTSLSSLFHWLLSSVQKVA